MPKGPYRAEQRSTYYWVVVDGRTGTHVSYPSSKSQCKQATKTLNRAYADAIAENPA